MTQTFEQLLLDIRESIEQASSPTHLTSILANKLKQAEDFEEDWINELYEQSEGFDNLIY